MDYTALNDEDLVNFLQNENEEAFAEIYNRYWKRIYALAIKYTKSPQIAQDLVQDVFLKLWINRNNYSHVREFKSYLLVGARNQIISSLRNKIFYESIETSESIEEELFLPEKQLSYKESEALLNEAIERLSPQQKNAYQLSRDKGLKYEEIAKEMGISLSTVKNHMAKAIQFIRKHLMDKYVHPVILMLILLGKK